jgi:hypothetical protein
MHFSQLSNLVIELLILQNKLFEIWMLGFGLWLLIDVSDLQENYLQGTFLSSFFEFGRVLRIFHSN